MFQGKNQLGSVERMQKQQLKAMFVLCTKLFVKIVWIESE